MNQRCRLAQYPLLGFSSPLDPTESGRSIPFRQSCSNSLGLDFLGSRYRRPLKRRVHRQNHCTARYRRAGCAASTRRSWCFEHERTRVRHLMQSELNTGSPSWLQWSSSHGAASLRAAIAGLPLLHGRRRTSRPAWARRIACWPALLRRGGPNFSLRNWLARAWLTTSSWPSLPAAPSLLGFCNAARTYDRSFAA